MGGTGSGQRCFKKATVRGRIALDTSDLKRLRLLVPGLSNHRGSLEWPGDAGAPAAVLNFALTVGPVAGALRVGYRLAALGEAIRCALPLVTTPCHLGGRRWWFLCPLARDGVPCVRRVKKLYLRGRYFGCRLCHELVYPSSQQSDSRVYALVRAGAGAMPDIEGASVTQLGLRMKALTLIQKRFERLEV